jgi:hypothetical protein
VGKFPVDESVGDGEEDKREGGGELDLLVGRPDIRSGRPCGRVSGVGWLAGVGGFRLVCVVSDPLLFSLFFCFCFFFSAFFYAPTSFFRKNKIK